MSPSSMRSTSQKWGGFRCQVYVTARGGTRCRIVVRDLDFDPTPWSELRYDDRVKDLAVDGQVVATPQSIVKSMQISRSDDIVPVSALQSLQYDSFSA